MIHQRLLLQAVEGRDPVLVEFVETIAPKILEHFATVPALGGSGQPRPAPDFAIPPKLRRYTEIELARFGTSNPDQSMATHILNGIFAGMRIAEKLPASKAMRTNEKRLWILGYVVHDYTKVYGLQVPAGELPAIRQLVARLGEQLNFGEFMADWQTLLDDVVWLGQNTQTREGANLNTRDYPNLKTPLRRLEILRILSSYTDILVHIQSPSEVLISTTHKTAENLREKLEILFGAGNAPRLAYHKLTEVRGLLSNLINNAVMDALTEQGYEPYLFFPNGVVYLTSPHRSPQIETGAILSGIWTRVADILTSNEQIGIKRDGKGLKVAPAMYELVDLAGLLRVGEQAAMRIKNSSAEDRVDAKRVTNEKLVVDLRTDRLAEFLVFVKRRVFDERFPKTKGVTEMLLEALGLDKQIKLADTEEQSGGVLLGWWYVAARYLASHRELDGEAELPALLESISAHALEFIQAQKLETNSSAPIRQAFFDHARRIVEINGQAAQIENSGFERELEIYLERKVRNKPICSLCSSPYTAIEQPETSVLFKPQQYSNKTQLGSTMLRRGICPICTVEMMLRLVQQGAPGKAFQDQKPVYLWLYPTYFFTTETARVVKSYINELEDLNIFALLNHLRKHGFTLSNLLTFEGFIQGEEATHSFTLIRQKYSEHDNAALFNFAMRPLGKSPTDTDAWIVPALYALALPLLMDLKIVVTPSFVPIFGTGADFQETAALDAPHQFTRYVLGRDRLRVDELEANLFKLLALYDLHVDVLAERTNLHWGQLNAIAKDIYTDPNYVFAYYERKERDPQKKAEMSQFIVKRYFEIYETLGGDAQMGLLGELVDAYAQFYRADWGKLGSAYAVLKPLAEAIDVTTESNPKTQTDDLTLLVAGAIGDLMERVWGGQADGFDPIVFSKDSGLGGMERRALSREKQMIFARLFVEKAFLDYCDGDRGLLRERANRMRSAARFYYLSNYGYTKKETNNG